MYIRVISILLAVATVAAAAGLLRPGPSAPLLPTPPAALPASAGDAGLGRRIDRLAFDGVPTERALEAVRARAGLSLVYPRENLPDTWTAPVTLSLKGVTAGAALRLVAGEWMQWGAIDGEVVEGGPADRVPRTFRAYDVSDLVSPPGAAGGRLPPTTSPSLPGSWFGVDGVHGGPDDFGLPPLRDETELADLLRSLAGVEGLNAQEQTLPGRLLGSFAPESDQELRLSLQQLRRPLGLASDDHPPTLLERRIARVRLDAVPLGRAVQTLADAAGANVAVRWFEGGKRVLDASVPVSERLDDVDLKTALYDTIRQARGDGGGAYAFETAEGVVVEWTFNFPSEERVLRVYDVSEVLRRFATAGPAPAGPAEKVLGDRIRRAVQPQTWRAEPGDSETDIGTGAGDGDGELRAWRGRLLVLQTSGVHREVWAYLHRLATEPRVGS